MAKALTSALVLESYLRPQAVSVETRRLVEDGDLQRGMIGTAVQAMCDDLDHDGIYAYLNAYELIQALAEPEATVNLFSRRLPVSIEEFGRTAPRVLNDIGVRMRYHRDRWLEYELLFRREQPVHERASMPYHHAPVEE